MPYRFNLDSAGSEFIFAPFHDPEHSSGITDQFLTNSASGLKRQHDWCWTTIAWNDADPAHSAFTYQFHAPFNVRNHDTLIVSLTLPKGASIEVALMRSGCRRASLWSQKFVGKGYRQELRIPITRLLPVPRSLVLGRRNIPGLMLRVQTAQAGPGVMTLSWVAMRSRLIWEQMRDLKSTIKPDWSPWLLPESAWGDWRFEYGLLFDADDLVNVRAKKEREGWREHFALLESRAQEYLKRKPEDDWGEFLPSRDFRYLRENEQGRTGYHWEALVVAFVGLVNKDPVMIRQALRYLMCMVHTRYWADSAEHRIPSSTWNQRVFMEEMTTTSVAILADWLGFALNHSAKNLIRKALWDKGVSQVKRDLMSFDYMHSMNQGVIFTRPLILGGLYLERTWPRAARSVDEAWEWMSAVLSRYIRNDGGIHEGPCYLCQMLTAALWSTISYCRARGINWRDEVRAKFSVVEPYIRIMSASQPGQIIPSADSRTQWLGGDVIPILAGLSPASAFDDVLLACLRSGSVHELTGTLTKSGGMIGMVYGPDHCSQSKSIVPELAVLLDSGKVTVSKKVDDLTMRFWASSSSQSLTHAHRDHGQFCLEVNGDSIFIDRGMLEYWFTEAHILSKSWLHNVLTPITSNGAFADQAFANTDEPMSTDLSVKGQNVVSIFDNGVWRDVMVAYSRRFELDLPNGVTVTDVATLRELGKVAFHLHSPYLFTISGKTAVLNLANFKLVIEFPWADQVICEQQMTDLTRRPIYHICAHSVERLEFSLQTIIRCE